MKLQDWTMLEAIKLLRGGLQHEAHEMLRTCRNKHEADIAAAAITSTLHEIGSPAPDPEDLGADTARSHAYLDEVDT